MQSAAPELVDLSNETTKTLENYGVNRQLPKEGGGRGKGNGNTYADFSRNCLLARRMVERGVRFVNIIHASWDHHSNLDPEISFNARMSDQPITALINDLKERGLLSADLQLATALETLKVKAVQANNTAAKNKIDEALGMIQAANLADQDTRKRLLEKATQIFLGLSGESTASQADVDAIVGGAKS